MQMFRNVVIFFLRMLESPDLPYSSMIPTMSRHPPDHSISAMMFIDMAMNDGTSSYNPMMYLVLYCTLDCIGYLSAIFGFTFCRCGDK